jgi:hypothetical protein
MPERSLYEYWALRTDLVFYLLKTVFEDTRSAGKIFLDTRIVRTAETIMRIRRLYEALGVRPEKQVVIRIRYTGLRDRVLSAADPMRAASPWTQTCIEDESQTTIRERVGDLESKLVYLVHAAVCRLTMLFDYFQPSKEQLVRPLIEQFLQKG